MEMDRSLGFGCMPHSVRDPVSGWIVKPSHDIAIWPSLEHSRVNMSTHTLNPYKVPIVILAIGDL